MTKAELPREARETIPDFSRLISTLALVDGEDVIVRINLRQASEGQPSDVASLVGELRHQSRARYQDHEYAVGTPYAERYPEHLAGGVLFLSQETFEKATLRTFDGNDYFAISITTRCLEILIQDSDSTGP